jgi:hypothetical protein
MTRSSNIVIGYLGKRQSDPKDSLAHRLAQRSTSKRRVKMVASNVGELIEILKQLDPAARILTTEPPFDGLKVVNQGNGSFLFCRPREPELKAAALTRS